MARCQFELISTAYKIRLSAPLFANTLFAIHIVELPIRIPRRLK